MKKTILTLGLFALLFTSCEKKEDEITPILTSTPITTEINTPIFVKKEIEEITVTDALGAIQKETIISEYTYDGSKIKSYTHSEKTEKATFNYTYTGDLITKRIVSNNDNEIIVSYKYDNNNKLIEAIEQYPSIKVANKKVYTYNANGTVSGTMFEGDLISQTKKVYNYLITLNTEGEIIKSVTSNSIGDVLETISYVYDDKNNSFKNITGYGRLNIIGGIYGDHLHNISSQKVTTNENTVDVVYAYEYNSEGYPTKKSTVINQDNEKTEYTKVVTY